MRINKTDWSTQLWLSANDTYDWANKSGGKWPCSVLSGHRLYAEFDKDNNLVDIRIDGRIQRIVNCPVDEFNAITSDFMKAGKQETS